MKKALAILMIFAVVASVAVAEVSIGAWGRGLFLPYVSDGDQDNPNTDTAPSWGGWEGDESRIGFTVAGNSDNVGFQVDITGENMGGGDQQKIWVKPIDMLTVSLGRIFDDTLRGNAVFGTWDWYRAYGSGSFYGEDLIFSRLGIANTQEEFAVVVKPMDALFIGVHFADLGKRHAFDPDGIPGNGDEYSVRQPLQNMFANMQIQVGYTIDGIGQIRAQYRSKVGTTDEDALVEERDDHIEVAFKFTMIENLYVDAGFKLGLNTDLLDYKMINLYANYKVAGATIHALASYTLLPDFDDDAMCFAGGVDYDVAGVTLQAEVRYMNYMAENAGNVFARETDLSKWDLDEDDTITFFAGVKKGFSNGLIGAGVEVCSETDTGFAIPIRMEYWF